MARKQEVSLEFSSNMATRLHRLGTIYSRIDGLIRKGHIAEIDKPIWFDVYRSFPPKYEPTFKRREPDIEVPEIFYREDALRAKIQKMYPPRVDRIDLKSDRKSLSERMLKSCQEYMAEGMTEEEALEKIKESKPKEELGIKEVLKEVLN